MIFFIISLVLILVIATPQDAQAWTAAVAIVKYLGIAAYVGVMGAKVITGVLAVGIIAAASFALSTIASLLTASPQEQKAASSRGQLVNTSDTQMPLPLIYGRQRVGINRVFVGVSGYDNKFLHVIGTICEGEIEGIVKVKGVPQIFLNDRLYNTIGRTFLGEKLFTYEFFNGSPTQDVCASLKSVIPEWNDPLRNTAYIYCVFTYDTDKFQGLPEVTVVVDGLKVKNLATGVVEYSNNSAYCGFDLMTRPSVRGGMEIQEARIDVDQIIGCAAYCDIKGWTTNIVLLQNTAVSDNLLQVLAPFRGDVFYSGSRFRMKYSDLNYEASVIDINEDDIVETGGKSTLRIAQPDIFDTPNAMRVKFINSGKLYQMDDYILADSAAIESDGDYREHEVYMRGVTDLAVAMKHANYLLERARYNKTVTFLMGSQGLALEPFDIFRLTNANYGLDAKLFRVSEITRTQHGLAAISGIEETAAMYDDVYDLSPDLFYTTTLPSILDPVESVRNVVLSEEVYFYRKRSYTRLKVTFDSPPPEVYPQWEFADIYVKIGDGDWKFMTSAVSSYQIDPVEEGVSYAIALISVSIFGSKQAFNDGVQVSKIIVGKTGIPGDITGFNAVASADTVTLFADELNEPDIAGYEVRLGAAWLGSPVVGFNETPNFRFVGVKPSPTAGFHQFWIAARSNNGNYSENPASTIVIVFPPPNYSTKNSWSWDFAGIGTHDNTEFYDNSGNATLKCSHTGGVLTGKWTSPEYDLGSVKKVRVWGDFVTELIGEGGTWAALFTGTMTWSEVGIENKRWNNILTPAVAGSISVKLMWGITSGSLTESVNKLEILSPEIEARYVQIEVTLTDPNVGSNLLLNELNMIAAYWV